MRGRYLSFLLLIFSFHLVAEDRVKYLGNSPGFDESYYLKLIDAALMATQDEYGDYKIQFVQEEISSNRKHELLVVGERVNIDRLVGFPKKIGVRNGMLLVDAPILNGFMGYRIPLILEENQPLFDKVNTLDDLRKIPMGLGRGWEGYIYEHNQISVYETTGSSVLFKMLIGKRYVYVPLAAIEIEGTYHIDQKPIKNLVPEKHLLLHMNLPVYFYVSPSAPVLAERLTKGLKIIQKDGKADAIFNFYFESKLKLLNLSARKVIELANPEDDGSLGPVDHSILLKY